MCNLHSICPFFFYVSAKDQRVNKLIMQVSMQNLMCYSHSYVSQPPVGSCAETSNYRGADITLFNEELRCYLKW